ncbi:hypothetical protein CR513_63136, partial [Mucuna pruriens]
MSYPVVAVNASTAAMISSSCKCVIVLLLAPLMNPVSMAVALVVVRGSMLLLETGSMVVPGKHNVDVGDSSVSSVDSIMAYMLCITLALSLVGCGFDHELCHAFRMSRHGGSDGCCVVILLSTSLAGCVLEQDPRLFCTCNFDSLTNLASASRRALSHCAMWLRLAASFDWQPPEPPSASVFGLWVVGSIPIRGMELNDCLLFLQAELSSFYVGSEVVSPPKPAALATSLKA